MPILHNSPYFWTIWNMLLSIGDILSFPISLIPMVFLLNMMLRKLGYSRNSCKRLYSILLHISFIWVQTCWSTILSRTEQVQKLFLVFIFSLLFSEPLNDEKYLYILYLNLTDAFHVMPSTLLFTFLLLVYRYVYKYKDPTHINIFLYFTANILVYFFIDTVLVSREPPYNLKEYSSLKTISQWEMMIALPIFVHDSHFAIVIKVSNLDISV